MAAAVLAGIGMQRVLDLRGRLGRAWVAPAAGLLAGLATAIVLVADGARRSSTLDAVLHRPASGERTGLALASVVWWLLPVGALAVTLVLARRPGYRGAAAVLVALLVAADLVHFAGGYQPMGPADRVVPPRTPAISYLERHRLNGRIVGVHAMRGDWSTLYRLYDVRGVDSPQPSLRYSELLRLVDPGAEPGDLSAIGALGPRVLGMLGVRYVVLTPQTRGKLPGLRVAYAGRDAKIYKNELAAPRAFVATTTRVVSSESDELATVAESSFDPRYAVVARAEEVGATSFPSPNEGSARVVREANASVTLEATLARPGIAVLGDAWAPGWSVEVDGQPAPPLQANVVLRGVAVPAGTHKITWRYRVPGLREGAALSALGLVAALAWAIAAARLRSRARTSRPRSSDPATTAA
jgi:hypothetical protein